MKLCTSLSRRWGQVPSAVHPWTNPKVFNASMLLQSQSGKMDLSSFTQQELMTFFYVVRSEWFPHRRRIEKDPGVREWINRYFESAQPVPEGASLLDHFNHDFALYAADKFSDWKKSQQLAFDLIRPVIFSPLDLYHISKILKNGIKDALTGILDFSAVRIQGADWEGFYRLNKNAMTVEGRAIFLEKFSQNPACNMDWLETELREVMGNPGFLESDAFFCLFKAILKVVDLPPTEAKQDEEEYGPRFGLLKEFMATSCEPRGHMKTITSHYFLSDFITFTNHNFERAPPAFLAILAKEFHKQLMFMSTWDPIALLCFNRLSYTKILLEPRELQHAMTYLLYGFLHEEFFLPGSSLQVATLTNNLIVNQPIDPEDPFCKFLISQTKAIMDRDFKVLEKADPQERVILYDFWEKMKPILFLFDEHFNQLKENASKNN